MSDIDISTPEGLKELRTRAEMIAAEFEDEASAWYDAAQRSPHPVEQRRARRDGAENAESARTVRALLDLLDQKDAEIERLKSSRDAQSPPPQGAQPDTGSQGAERPPS